MTKPENWTETKVYFALFVAVRRALRECAQLAGNAHRDDLAFVASFVESAVEIARQATRNDDAGRAAASRLFRFDRFLILAGIYYEWNLNAWLETTDEQFTNHVGKCCRVLKESILDNAPAPGVEPFLLATMSEFFTDQIQSAIVVNFQRRSDVAKFMVAHLCLVLIEGGMLRNEKAANHA